MSAAADENSGDPSPTRSRSRRLAVMLGSMELSITRWKALVAVAALAGGGYYLHLVYGGAPPALRDALRDVGPREPAAPSPRRPTRADPSPGPAPASPPAERARAPEAAGDEPEAAAEAAPGAPPRRERTADEQARSKLALAVGYAENRRYDRALEVLDEAEALGPSAELARELAQARARILGALEGR